MSIGENHQRYTNAHTHAQKPDITKAYTQKRNGTKRNNVDPTHERKKREKSLVFFFTVSYPLLVRETSAFSVTVSPNTRWIVIIMYFNFSSFLVTLSVEVETSK